MKAQILIVDDERLIRTSLRRAVEELGHHVRYICYTGAEDLARELEQATDVLIVGAFTRAARSFVSRTNMPAHDSVNGRRVCISRMALASCSNRASGPPHRFHPSASAATCGCRRPICSSWPAARWMARNTQRFPLIARRGCITLGCG